MDIVEIKDLFPNMPISRYNVAAWQKYDEDRVVLIGREVEQAGASGQPDKGKLVLIEMDVDGNVTHERVIWEPNYKNVYLEDPRALQLPSGNIIIGLTALLKNDEHKWEAFPALTKIDSESSWDDALPPITLIQSFGPGKNLTPLDAHTFLFRPEHPDYFHKLLIFTFKGLNPQTHQDLDFPTDLPWAKWRFGTAMPPLWITENEALLIIHGINIVDNKYVYSLGRAKLSRKDNHYSIKVHPDPILTPDSFITDEGQPLVDELHPGLRRVVYACGGIIKRKKTDILYLYVNVGDRKTFEVGLSLNSLKEGLFEEDEK